GRNQQALDKLKEVVGKYPNTQEAKQAVATAKLIYVDEGRVSEYAASARNLDFIEVTDAELDRASYESAHRKQVEGKPDMAIRGFEDYLREFPRGLHTQGANFALAQLYFAKGDRDKALPRYRSEEHTSELQSRENLVCRPLPEKKTARHPAVT